MPSSEFVIETLQFLADGVAACSMIGYWHDTIICLSICLSVTKCVSCSGSVYGFESCTVALPIHFFRHFFCRYIV